MQRLIAVCCGVFLLPDCSAAAAQPPGRIPAGFVYLGDVAPSIVQDMRYATPNNFTGKPVDGYDAAECVLKLAAAKALERAQAKAQELGLSLKVYDCYRPGRAVRAFLAWAAAPEDDSSKRFYPNLQKSALVPGYIASRSQHSAGIAVDVTLINPSHPGTGPTHAGNCTAAPADRESDGSLDMGTAFDCFDPKASTASASVTPDQHNNRMLLKRLLEGAGFQNYPAEWWHFFYAQAEGAKRYDFPVAPRSARLPHLPK